MFIYIISKVLMQFFSPKYQLVL